VRVICLDVGRGQLHWELRNDPRVTVMERTNVRHVRPEDLPFVPELVLADLSFISLRLVLPVLREVMAVGSELIALIKPQFEAGKGKVGKGGVVRDPGVHRQVLEEITGAAAACGFELVDLAPSPLRGAEGNLEYFAWWRRKDGAASSIGAAVDKALGEAWKQDS
jgi:23S rRNA (cytidine1920-2'-O)/16S rRNA (cytidine1409-2'-O)-methyltransferase